MLSFWMAAPVIGKDLHVSIAFRFWLYSERFGYHSKVGSSNVEVILCDTIIYNHSWLKASFKPLVQFLFPQEVFRMQIEQDPAEI